MAKEWLNSVDRTAECGNVVDDYHDWGKGKATGAVSRATRLSSLCEALFLPSEELSVKDQRRVMSVRGSWTKG